MSGAETLFRDRTASNGRARLLYKNGSAAKDFVGAIRSVTVLVLRRFAIGLGLTHYGCMYPYSEDLRKKIVEAKQRGMPISEVARTFDVGISSVKRYAKTAREGGALRPKRCPGRPPKTDERARRLLGYLSTTEKQQVLEVEHLPASPEAR